MLKKEQTFTYGGGGGTETTRYYYNQARMLEYIDVEESDQDLEFTYDGLGRRIMVRRGNVGTVYQGKVVSFTAAETRKFVYLGGSVIRELDNSTPPNVLKEYVRGLDMGGGIGSIIYQKKSSDYYYYHYNHKGDVVALTDGNGDLGAFYEYDAWGNVMAEAEVSRVDNPYRYSTKEWDKKSGLCYFGARYYSPEIGRWTQRDPLGTVDGLNLYVYVVNSAPNYIDPLGLQLFPPIIFIGPEETLPAEVQPRPRPRRKPVCEARYDQCFANCTEHWLPAEVKYLYMSPLNVDRLVTIFYGLKKGRWPGGKFWQSWWHKYAQKHHFGTKAKRRMRFAGKVTVWLFIGYGAYNAGVILYCDPVCHDNPEAY